MIEIYKAKCEKKALKCAGQTKHVVQFHKNIFNYKTSKVMNSTGERKELSKMFSCTLVIIKKETFYNFQHFLVI